MLFKSLCSLFLFGSSALFAQAQAPQAVLQSVGFNSTFSLSQSQIKSANLSETLTKNLNNVIRFQSSQYANGGPLEDVFYNLPALNNKTGPIQPGTLLKTQSFTNGTPFNIPANTALSRILYTSANINGTVIPASAYVLWPFTPRKFSNTTGTDSGKSAVPVVLWAHGTSGYFANAAPSTDRNLWYSDMAPFTLALAGYAVVAADYAGLGISRSWNNGSIPHPYLASPAAAYDSLYAMQASLKAFPGLLDSRFTAMGHSQGGGVAWSVAEVLAEHPELGPGYLGSIAGSPTTQVYSGNPLQLVAVPVSLALKSIFPSFELSDWLTPAGVARANLFREIQGSISAAVQLFTSDEVVVKPDFQQTWYAAAYARLANAGRKKVKGPLLVISGSNDVVVPFNVTSQTVQDTCKMYPGNDLEYLVSNGTGHVTSLDSTRQIWLKWIEDRFEGKSVSKGCTRTQLNSFLPIERYKPTDYSFKQWAGAPEYTYEAPLGL